MSTIAEMRSTVDWYDTKIAAEQDAERKGKLIASRDMIESKLEAAMQGLSLESKPTVPSAQIAHAQKVKAIESALHDVLLFRGTESNEAERFTARLNQMFHLLVTNNDVSLESDFVRLATMRLSEDVFQHLLQSAADISSFAKFKEVIKSTYGPKLNAVQQMNKLYDLEFDGKAKLSLFAQRCHETIRNGYVAMNAQWKKVKKVDTDIPGEQVALFFGMCYMTQHIKNADFQLYRDVIRDLDEVMDPNQLASRAEYFKDRVGGPLVSNCLFGNAFRYGNRRNHTDERQRDKKAKEAKGRSRESSPDSERENDHASRAERSSENKHDKYRKKGKPWKGKFKPKKHQHMSDHDDNCSDDNGSKGADQVLRESSTAYIVYDHNYPSQSVFTSANFL